MKLTVLGGAGVRAIFLARGVAARAKETGIDELVLYDIDPARLALIGPLCARAAFLAEPELRVSATTELDSALSCAGAVISTFRVGGDRSRVEDELMAQKYGLLPQETTGLGGFLMAMRTIPTLAAYSERVAQCAPGSLLFNFANPSGLVTQAMRMAGWNNVIGICDTPSSTNLRIAAALGVAVDELDIRWAGLNHLSWITSVRRNFEELLPSLTQDLSFLRQVPEFALFEPDLIRRLGCLPNEYLYYYYYRERAVANIGRGGPCRGQFIEANNRELFESLANIDLERNPDLGLAVHAQFMRRRESSYMAVETGDEIRSHPAVSETEKSKVDAADSGAGYAKVVLDLLAARHSGQKSTLVLSVPNQGRLPFLQPEDVAEITCQTTAHGPQPLEPGYIPESARLLMTQVKLFERFAAEAVLEKRRELARSRAIDALMAHPLIGSYSLAKAIANDAFPGD